MPQPKRTADVGWAGAAPKPGLSCVQPRRAAATRPGRGRMTPLGSNASLATETVIGPRLGSPLGRMRKLPVMPSETWVEKTASITLPRAVPPLAIAVEHHLAACPA